MDLNRLSDATKMKRVFSSAVSFDGQEVERVFDARGFLAERFVKPPVDVFVDFGFPFSLHRLEFFTSVGSQVSVGFEVFTATFHDDDELKCVDGRAQHSSSRLRRPSTIESLKTLTFRRLARTTAADADAAPPILRFANGKRVSRRLWTADVRELRHGCTRATESVDCLRIRIFRTKGSSVPGLRGLRVFGVPDWNLIDECARSAINEASQRLSADDEAGLENGTEDIEEAVKDDRQSDMNVAEGFEPEPEFLDSLTYQVMTIPMLLPSGHNIDLSTLEKYNEEEAKWGRPPSDPFTNLAYSALSKPLPNASLKSRIDSFLVLRSNDHSLPRTLGRRNSDRSLSAPLSHSLPADRRGSKAPSLDEDQLLMKGSSVPKRSSTERKRKKSAEKLGHEDRVKDSLDEALAKILASAKRRTGTGQGSPSVVCVACDGVLFGSAYRLSCRHLMCRSCLDNANFKVGVECFSCGRKVMRRDVEKFHAA